MSARAQSAGRKVRLLRDDVVIHEGSLSTLKRFKDDVREVQQNYECGMSFESYNDLKVGDIIECFDVEEIAPNCEATLIVVILSDGR